MDTSTAQRNCGAMEYLDYQLEQDPKRTIKLQQIENQTNDWISGNKEKRDRSIITIPVVFHVVYNSEHQNISDTRLQEQLDVLNADFRRLNLDAEQIWPQAADLEIEFCLASFDPKGNPTSGITRTKTEKEEFDINDDIKFTSKGGKDCWPTTDYLNIWVCNMKRILGFAQFPGGDPQTDGVVLHYRFTGVNGASPPFNLGRTATHEVGHWLNLKHIWGEEGCQSDDNVQDTPRSDAPNYGCQHGHVSCGSLDMVQNFMDYSDDSCMNLFTEGQKSRILAQFAPNGPRESLLYSNGCGDGTAIQDSFDCKTNLVNVSILLDKYPEETSWTIQDSMGMVVAVGGTYGDMPDGSLVSERLCLPNGCYTFAMRDSYGDGICCSYGRGEYNVLVGSDTIVSGNTFEYIDSSSFCLEMSIDSISTCFDGIMNGDETGIDCGGSCEESCHSCEDGIQNGNETGVDCGGPDCMACEEFTAATEILASYFEDGMDEWIDGGSDCYRYSGIYSYEGRYSIRIRDNSGLASSLISPALELTNYSSIDISFYFYPNSMEEGESFDLQFYDNNDWYTLATWTSGTDFDNDMFYSSNLNVSSTEYNFNSNNQLRFMCDASGNADRIFLDQIIVTGQLEESNRNKEVLTEIQRSSSSLWLYDEDVLIFPNPAHEYIDIEAEETIISVSITDLTGKTVIRKSETKEKKDRLDISILNQGVYFITINTEEESTTKKIVKN